MLQMLQRKNKGKKRYKPGLQQQPLSVLGTRQSVASVGRSACLLLPFVAFWRLAVGRRRLWHFD